MRSPTIARTSVIVRLARVREGQQPTIERALKGEGVRLARVREVQRLSVGFSSTRALLQTS